MGNEQASRVVQAPGIKTNQDELARPPIVRYNIEDEDVQLFSESERDVFTEASRSANYRFPPPKQAEVFRTPEECHIFIEIFTTKFHEILISKYNNQF